MSIKFLEPRVELVRPATSEQALAELDLLIYTKSTRLQGKQTLQEIHNWPMDKKLDHLAYMRDTIKSSWEFLQYTFEIHGVSREFTHQFVRTRDMVGVDDPAFGEPDANWTVVSFAQESQRTVDASGNGAVLPVGVKPENEGTLKMMLDNHGQDYQVLMSLGEPPQVARAVLPTATATSIICQASLRALHHMAEIRLCTRTQGQYQNVFRLMREAVYERTPWVRGWIEVYCVNTGTCCFPRYDKCPIQGPLFNPETGVRFDRKTDSRATIQDDAGSFNYGAVGVETVDVRPAKRSEILQMWEENRHEATPVARDGKSM
jgi:thymidylate synthase ThyX